MEERGQKSPFFHICSDRNPLRRRGLLPPRPPFRTLSGGRAGREAETAFDVLLRDAPVRADKSLIHNLVIYISKIWWT